MTNFKPIWEIEQPSRTWIPIPYRAGSNQIQILLNAPFAQCSAIKWPSSVDSLIEWIQERIITEKESEE